jgi:hypothetical protein
MITVAIILFLLTLGVDLFIDLRKYKKEDYKVNHKKKWIRIFTLFPGAILLGQPNVVLIVITYIGMLFYYWFLFDGLYNICRMKGFSWWFTGSNDPDDAYSDDFLQTLKPWQHKAIKIGGIVIFTVLYLLVK